MDEHHLLIFLTQVLLLLGLARGIGELLRRFGQPPLVGEILVGVLLGPSLLGRAWPELQISLFPKDLVQQGMLDALSWFGVLFLLLETGLEVDISAAWRQRGPALRLGVIGVLVPLLVGFGLTLMLPERYFPEPERAVPFALFMGTTMAISAIVIIARVLHDMDLVKSDLGLLTLCGYAVNDILAWVIFSTVLAIAAGQAVGVASIVALLVFTVVFTGASLTLGLRFVGHGIGYVSRQLPGHPGAILSLVCCLGLLMGALTQWMGLTALFGFFLAGIMAGDSSDLSERTRMVIGQMVHAVFVPLYFASIGLRHDFIAGFDLFLVAFVSLVSIGAKFAGAWLGALGSEISSEDRVSLGIAFTPSGVTGIVVAGVALEVGVLDTRHFVAIVVSALVSSVLVAPWLEWSIRRRKAFRLLDFLRRDEVVPRLAARTRWDAIDELCSAAAAHPDAPHRRNLVEAVRAREALIGTGTGHGIAIPHARLPDLAEPMLCLGRSTTGLDWNAPDGEPVHLVFLLLTPQVEHGLQLQILAAIAAAMASSAARQRLIDADGAEGMWDVLRAALQAQTLARVTA